MSKRKDRLGFIALLVILVMLGASLSNVNSEPVEYPVTECNDGIDNDFDGGIDANATGAGDPECTLTLGVIVHNCPLWISEGIPPSTWDECQGN
jgi:hypothetical protein